MRIAYLGNFKFPWCSEVHFTSTLEQLGNEVLRLQEDEVGLQQVVETANSCDLFGWTRTYGMLRFDGFQMLKMIKVPTFSYHLDYYFGIQRQTEMDRDAFWKTDYVFQPDGDHQAEFTSMGINSIWQPPGVYQDECNLEKRDMVRDLVFVGSYDGYHPEWPWRQKLVNHLRNDYPQCDFYPKGEAMRGDKLNELYQTTKIAIGDSLNPIGNQTYTSDRIFETTGRGGFILYPRIPWLATIFPEEIFYDRDDWQGLSQKIQYYLTHHDEREDLRQRCHEITTKDHTYTQRFTKALEVIDA